VCLCRAVYARKKVYLLDDVFSSLDVHVADRIFYDLILDFWVQRQGSTVIFITSHYKYLNYAFPGNILLFNQGRLLNY